MVVTFEKKIAILTCNLPNVCCRKEEPRQFTTSSSKGDTTMTNPKYRFFRDELENDDVLRYANGKEVTFEPSTNELKEGVKRIVKELEARGFRRTAHQCQNSVGFTKTEFCKSAYIGSQEFSSTRAALNSTSSEMASRLQRNLDGRTRRRFVRR